MKKTRIVLVILMLQSLLFSFMLSGCGQKEDSNTLPTNSPYEKGTINYQSLSSLVSYPELAEALGYLKPLKLNYLGNVLGGPQDIQSLATGDVDIAQAFNGAIIKAQASGVDVVSVLTSYGSDEKTLQGFYVLQDSPLRSARDLIGKKVSVNTLGAHAEFVLREYLYRNGLNKDEVNKVELIVLPPSSGEQALRAGQIEVAQLSYVAREKALERGGIRPLFTDVDLYGPFNGGSYVVRREFLKTHPHVARKLIEASAQAIEWARTQPRDVVAKKIEEITASKGRTDAKDIGKYWRSTGIASIGGQVSAEDYQRWIDWLVRDEQLKAGQLNTQSLFDNSLNPYQAQTQNKSQ